MLFTSKSNTNATTNTTATETTETSNNNGGLLKGIAIGVGTLAGIGLAAFGGTKAYKHFHVKDENRLDDVTDNETPAENAEDTTNEATVESFNEVDTEEPANEAPVEAEEAKTEETENTEPVDKHAKTEELVNQLTEEASKCASIETASSLISSIKKMDEMVGSVAGMYRTIGDNAKIDSAIAELYKAFNSYWNNLDVKISNCDKESFAACASEIDDVNNAWWDMQCIQMNRIATETMSYVINKYAHMERVAKRKEEKAALAAETQAAQKFSDETQAEEKKSVGETKTVENAFDVFKDGHKESNKVDGETKTSTKPSVGENQTTENCFDAFKEGHKETNKVERETKSSTKKVTGETKTVTKSDKKQTKSKASKTVDAADQAINQFIEAGCEEMVKSSLKSLASLDYVLDVKDQKPCEWLHEVAKHVDSNIDGLLKTNHTAEAFKLIKVAKRDIEYAVSEVAEYMIIAISNADTVEDLDNIKASVAALSDSIKLNHVKVYQATINRINDVKRSLNNMYTQIKTAGETKTAEPVVDEKQATNEEVPSETKIGNSEVLSDDGETVTLKASVPEDSVQNVMDVIDIVSKIPNRENPEKTDMPYYIRVIGGRISGITEPEATFLAYNDKTKSNDFIDACVSLCNMVGTGICNLADQKSNPIGSLGWINRSYDELIASGVIDNTYNPQAMRDVLTKARNEATRVLADMVKKSNETQDEANSSGETKTEETLTYTMSDKIQEAVQQSDETAATTEPESNNQAPMSPEASSLAAKLQEVGELMRAEKWSDASEFYKTQLTPYLADDGLTKELREEIMSIKTKATNMMMSQKQLEAKKKAASAKASKRKSSKRRRH